MNKDQEEIFIECIKQNLEIAKYCIDNHPDNNKNKVYGDSAAILMLSVIDSIGILLNGYFKNNTKTPPPTDRGGFYILEEKYGFYDLVHTLGDSLPTIADFSKGIYQRFRCNLLHNDVLALGVVLSCSNGPLYGVCGTAVNELNVSKLYDLLKGEPDHLVDFCNSKSININGEINKIDNVTKKNIPNSNPFQSSCNDPITGTTVTTTITITTNPPITNI